MVSHITFLSFLTMDMGWWSYQCLSWGFMKGTKTTRWRGKTSHLLIFLARHGWMSQGVKISPYKDCKLRTIQFWQSNTYSFEVHDFVRYSMIPMFFSGVYYLALPFILFSFRTCCVDVLYLQWFAIHGCHLSFWQSSSCQKEVPILKSHAVNIWLNLSCVCLEIP